MGRADRFPGLDERSSRQLMLRARSLVGHYGFKEQDLEDIEQELYLHLYQQLAKYDPSKASKATYVDRVLGNHARDLIRAQTAEKRDWAKGRSSLDQPVSPDAESDLTLGECISADHRLPDAGRPADAMESIDLRIDTDRVLSGVDHDVRALCRGLASGRTPVEIAGELSICRQTFYTRKAKVRRIFEEAGMAVYAGM